MEQRFTDASGRILGWTVQRGSFLYIHDKNGHQKGWYCPRTNQTYNQNGALVARGNMLTSLLWAL